MWRFCACLFFFHVFPDRNSGPSHAFVARPRATQRIQKNDALNTRVALKCSLVFFVLQGISMTSPLQCLKHGPCEGDHLHSPAPSPARKVGQPSSEPGLTCRAKPPNHPNPRVYHRFFSLDLPNMGCFHLLCFECGWYTFQTFEMRKLTKNEYMRMSMGKPSFSHAVSALYYNYNFFCFFKGLHICLAQLHYEASFFQRIWKRELFDSGLIQFPLMRSEGFSFCFGGLGVETRSLHAEMCSQPFAATWPCVW